MAIACGPRMGRAAEGNSVKGTDANGAETGRRTSKAEKVDVLRKAKKAGGCQREAEKVGLPKKMTKAEGDGRKAEKAVGEIEGPERG